MDNLDGFEVFEGRRARSQSGLFVTIQQRGNFCLNRAAFMALDDPKFVVMLFSRLKRQIAFRVAKNDEANKIPVRAMGKGSNRLIAGRTFTKEYAIDTSTSRKYRAKIHEGYLVVDLNTEGADVSVRKDGTINAMKIAETNPSHPAF